MRVATVGEQNITYGFFYYLTGCNDQIFYVMRFNKTVKFLPAPDLRPEMCFSSPMYIQPPTFRSIAEAYAHFTRHRDDYDEPDYEDDGPNPPSDYQNVDTLDFIANPINEGPAPSPSRPANDGQRASDEPERGTSEDEEPSSSTSE